MGGLQWMIMCGFPEKTEIMRVSIGSMVEKVNLVLFAPVRLRELPRVDGVVIFVLSVNPVKSPHQRCGSHLWCFTSNGVDSAHLVQLVGV